MVLRSTTPPAEPDATAAGQSVPAEVLTLIRGGLTFNGVRVVSLRVELADGTTQRLEMPVTADAAAELSPLAGRMVEALERVGDWVNGAALAMILDPSGDLEHHTGSFKRAVAELKRAGLIRSNKALGYRAK